MINKKFIAFPQTWFKKGKLRYDHSKKNKYFTIFFKLGLKKENSVTTVAVMVKKIYIYNKKNYFFKNKQIFSPRKSNLRLSI